MRKLLNSQKYKLLVQKYGRDILESDGMLSEKKYIHHGSFTVYDHSVSVAVFCLYIAAALKIKYDRRALVRGALLHDYFLYDWHIPDSERGLHGFTHARCAAENASRDFELDDIQRNMIAAHMFPLGLTLPKYRESIILCAADKVCAVYETFCGKNTIKKL